MERLKTLVFALVATMLVLPSVHTAHAAGYVDVFQPNLVSKCDGRTEQDAALCLDNIVKSIKQEQKNLKEFPLVLNDIRGPLIGSSTTYDGCTAAEVNGSRPSRKPATVNVGPACSVEWNAYSAAIGKLMEETCVTKDFYKDADRLKGWKNDAENAENDYDRCFADRLDSVHANFKRDWEISNGDAFFSVYKKAVTEYKSYNLDGQLRAVFNGCKAAVQSLQKKDKRAAEALIARGICQ